MPLLKKINASLFICLFTPASFLLAADNQQMVLGDFSQQSEAIPES